MNDPVDNAPVAQPEIAPVEAVPAPAPAPAEQPKPVPPAWTGDPTKPLRNKRHERFCHLIARKDPSVSNAAIYRIAYPTCDPTLTNSSASKLLKRADVKARIKYVETLTRPEIEEIGADATLTHRPDREGLLDKLVQLIGSNQPSAALDAIKQYRDLAGIHAETKDAGQLTPDQAAGYRERLIAALQARLAASGRVVIEIVTASASKRVECDPAQVQAIIAELLPPLQVVDSAQTAPPNNTDSLQVVATTTQA